MLTFEERRDLVSSALAAAAPTAAEPFKKLLNRQVAAEVHSVQTVIMLYEC